ncbi:FadR family transcriptional regulator [Pigmentiphaga sp. H8]|nr:FadR family transcriptional regulator [Pigmentiphaga sp. H8]
MLRLMTDSKRARQGRAGAETASATPAWEPVHIETLSNQLIQQIRDSFLAGRLKTGDYLGSERSLAEQFGVSRVAIRDTLRSLVAIGLIEVRTGKAGGAWIAAGNISHYADLLSIQLRMMGVTELEMVDAQAAIEIQATGLAVLHAGPDDLARLEEFVARLHASMNEPEVFTGLAMDFHALVVQASKNRALSAQFLAIRQILQSNYSLHARQDRAERTVAFAQKMLAHFRARDAVAARNEMAARLAHIRTATLDLTGAYWLEPEPQAAPAPAPAPRRARRA